MFFEATEDCRADWQTVRLMLGVMPHNSWASNRGGIASHGETRFDIFGLKRDSEGTYP